MIWQDDGFLLKIFKYSENSSIADFYTLDHGKTTGIVFGSTSKKNKSYLVLGNKIHLNYSSKNENSTGNFKIEIAKINTPYFFDYSAKLNCINYALDLVRNLTVENFTNRDIYRLLDKFFANLHQSDWINKFVFWELDLFKSLGYEINYLNYVKKKITSNGYIYVLKNDERRIIPNFLVEKLTNNLNRIDVINGLTINGDFLDKTIIESDNQNILNLRKQFTKLVI